MDTPRSPHMTPDLPPTVATPDLAGQGGPRPPRKQPPREEPAASRKAPTKHAPPKKQR
jgi:hypothetical protein